MKTTRTPSGKTSTTKEFREIDEYETFNDKGKDINLALSTRRYASHLRCCHDGRHKARLVAGGHLTETPSTLCTHQSYLSEASVSYISIGTQRLRNMEY
jgi:hypothetical protein